MLSFDEVFPKTKGINLESKVEVIKLAHKVAAALKKESENLAKERENNISSRFFSTSK